MSRSTIRHTLLYIILGLVFLGMTALTGFLAMAVLAPMHVDQPGYPIQLAAEQSLATLTPSNQGKSDYLLTLFERRTSDLEGVLGTERESSALTSATVALKQSILGLNQAPSSGLLPLRSRLLKDIQWMRRVLGKAKTPNAAVLAAWLPVLETATSDSNQTPDQLLALLAPQEPAAQAGATSAQVSKQQTIRTIAPRIVRFQIGTVGAMHTFFPLEGKHSEIACEKCHADGVYAGIPRECSACHAKDAPQNHYPAECSQCHTTIAWKPATFNHAAFDTSNCESCHNQNKPANHYPGQCSECHQNNAWKPAHFSHIGGAAANCQSCHARPKGHYNGQCSACHSINAWRPAHFNHAVAGATDCQSCHARPNGHFGGQCSACHSTNGWKPAHFDHGIAGATDCQSCHSRPNGHFGGQCSACHSTNGWKPASFNHSAAGATDCQSCHSRPENHFSGQCSNCHSTNTWSGATFTHEFDMNHGGANGQCALCHPSGTSATDCSSCHIGKPGGGGDD
jgi:hypothetical protein